MEIRVRIPPPWKNLVGGKDIINAKGKTVREVLQSLTEICPELKDIILNREDEVRQFIIHVNNEDIRSIQDLDTPLDEGDQLSVITIIPLLAGG